MKIIYAKTQFLESRQCYSISNLMMKAIHAYFFILNGKFGKSLGKATLKTSNDIFAEDGR